MSDKLEAGRKLLDHLVAGDFPAVVAHFDEDMTKALPVDVLKAQWEQITQQAGAFKQVIDSSTAQHDGVDLVGMLLDFENGRLAFRAVFRGDQIAGMFFTPPKTG